MMPKGSEELINARKEEIIDACASLYETMGFNEITIRSIGKKDFFYPHFNLQLFFRPRKKSSLVCCGVSTKHGLLILRRSSAAK